MVLFCLELRGMGTWKGRGGKKCWDPEFVEDVCMGRAHLVILFTYFVLFYFIWNKFSLCSPGCPRTYCLALAGLEFTEIHWPLPPKGIHHQGRQVSLLISMAEGVQGSCMVSQGGCAGFWKNLLKQARTIEQLSPESCGMGHPWFWGDLGEVRWVLILLPLSIHCHKQCVSKWLEHLNTWI